MTRHHSTRTPLLQDPRDHIGVPITLRVDNIILFALLVQKLDNMDEVPEARPGIRRARELDRGQFVRVALAGRFRDLDNRIPRPVSGRADVAQPADAVVD